MKIALVAAALLSTQAFAATDPKQVEAMDLARQGNLPQLVLGEFAKSQTSADCEGGLVKYQIVKVSAESYHQEKRPGTKYDYSAVYLVSQKCHSGSTFAGAMIDNAKSALYKGSFTSAYNSKNGPARMESLKIEFVKELSLQ